MDKLQTGIEPSFAVFLLTPVFVQPGKASFNNPSLGDHLESMQFGAFGNLNGDLLSQRILHTFSKRLARVATVTQQALDFIEILKRIKNNHVDRSAH